MKAIWRALSHPWIFVCIIQQVPPWYGFCYRAYNKDGGYYCLIPFNMLVRAGRWLWLVMIWGCYPSKWERMIETEHKAWYKSGYENGWARGRKCTENETAQLMKRLKNAENKMDLLSTLPAPSSYPAPEAGPASPE